MRNSFYRDSGEDSTTNTLFRDLLLGALGSIMLVLLIVIFFIGIKKANEENQRNRGNIRVEVIWAPELNVDVDTWAQAPGDIPVGYSNLNGKVFNLHRDDLGNHQDLSGINYEVMTSRGIPKGEWIVNLHWFSNAHGATEVPVKVLITIKKDDSNTGKAAPVQILSKVVILKKVGGEITVIRFNTDANRDVVKSSLSTIQKRIRPMNSNSAGGPQ